MVNALGRMEGTYQEQCGEVRRELDIICGQLGDFEARLGRQFGHAAYLEELAALRDRLKLALSDHPTEGEDATDLADTIRALRASHQVEAPVKKAKAVEPMRSTPPATQLTPVPAPEPVADIAVEEPDAEPIPTFRQRVSRGGQMSLF